MKTEELIDQVQEGKLNGRKLWVCDLRYNNYNEKPIRHVRPTEVLVRSNTETTKTIYYSASHFVGLNKNGEPVASKIIALFDNTGFRGRTGTPLHVFDDEAACRKAYMSQVKHAIKELELYKIEQIKAIDSKIEELKSYT